jgi:GGDEF domain-containing protein
MLPERPDPASASNRSASDRQDVVLGCYLSALLAMAKSMRAVCSRVGLIYGDRLVRLPRRLGFDSTPQKLEESRQVLEADLVEYTEATTAWLDAGSGLAREIVAAIDALDPGSAESQNLHAAMLEDLAEQMAESAEVDPGSDLRPALKRYALGLRSYLQRRRLESGSSLKDLRCRADRLAEWLARADLSNSTDVATGLPNRPEIERQLEAFWHTPKPVSVLIFTCKPTRPDMPLEATQVLAKHLADRLADLVRPRDVVGRWAPNQFAVIFECSGSDAMQRARSIVEWLSGDYSAVVDGAAAAIRVGVTVSVVERLPDEALADLVHRIEQAQPAQPAADVPA